MTIDEIDAALYARIKAADDRYGPFASTHEALGVIIEEFDELREAIRSNDLDRVQQECLDMAAPLIRLAMSINTDSELCARSVK